MGSLNIQNDTSQTKVTLADEWISSETSRAIETTTRVYMTIPVAAFGMIANIASIIVFSKLGVKDTINLQLMCLAASDLCMFMVALACGVAISFRFKEEMILSVRLESFIFSWPISPLFVLSSCITVFITIARCLCITMPHKVKTLLSQRVVTVILLLLFLFFLMMLFPIYFGMRPMLVEINNKTVYDAISTKDLFLFQAISKTLVVGSQLFCYGAMLIATSFLIIGLHRHAKRRQAMVTTADSQDSSNKDMKVVKMVVLIAIVFIIFSLPELLIHFANMAEPEFGPFGRQSNTHYASVGISKLSDCVNGTINIFIYLKMSTSFRQMFYKTFCFNKK